MFLFLGFGATPDKSADSIGFATSRAVYLGRLVRSKFDFRLLFKLNHSMISSVELSTRF